MKHRNGASAHHAPPLRGTLVTLVVLLGCEGQDASLPTVPITRHPTEPAPQGAPMGAVSITTGTTGAAPRGGHDVHWEFEFGPAAIDPNGTTVMPLPAGQYWPHFRPAPNCSVTNAAIGLVEVRPAETTDLTLEIDCLPAGWIVAVISAHGEEIPSTFSLRLIRATPPPTVRGFGVSPFGTAPSVVMAGDWTGVLDVPRHCELNTTNPVQFNVEEEETTVIRFDVGCVRHSAILRIALNVTGKRVLGGTFFVGLNGGCDPLDEYSVGWCVPVPGNGVLSLTLSPADYSVKMFGPTICAISPSDPVLARVTRAETTDVAFSASCS